MKVRVRNLRPFQMKEIKEDPKGAIETLKKGIGVVEKHCSYWVSAGTALGIIRDNQLIPWDTDMDIEVMERDLTTELMTDLEKEGFDLVRLQFAGNGFISQAAFVDKVTGYIFDIYAYIEEGDNLINYNEHGRLVLPRSFITNKVKEEFAGKEMWFPGPRCAYAKHRYGDDWQKPTGKKGAWEEQAGNIDNGR